MPIYEYRCQDCARVSSFFVRSIGSEVTAVCSHCGSGDMERRMSSFAMGKTVSSVHEQFAPGSEHRSPEYYSGPPKHWPKRRGSLSDKFGVDMPQSVRDNIDAARSGETPKGLDL